MPLPSESVPPATTSPELGSIAFGEDYDPVTLDLVGPGTRFGLDDEVAWVASIGPTDGGELDLMVYEVGGRQREVVVSGDWSRSDRKGDLIAESMEFGRFLEEPGEYILRYIDIESRAVLAEGRFELTR